MYEAHYYCDKCKSRWKTYYAEYKRPYPRDACQTCTDAMEWKKLDEVVVKPYLFKTLDE